MVAWEVSLAWGLGIGGNYVWFFVIVFILMVLGGGKRWERRGGEVLKSLCEGQTTKDWGTNFFRVTLTPPGTMMLST